MEGVCRYRGNSRIGRGIGNWFPDYPRRYRESGELTEKRMNSKFNTPPKLFLRFFRWYCHPKLVKHIEGDLMEVYNERLKETGKRKADAKFVVDVLTLF